MATALFVLCAIPLKGQITDYGYGHGRTYEEASLYSSPQPKEEIRAVWLTTVKGLDWPKTYAKTPYSIEKQKRELTDILDKYVEANINTVLLQTRIRGSVIYPSKIEPWDECLTGTPGKHPGYDPLAFAIEECHKRGLELHTWLVSIPLGATKKQQGYGAQSITRKRPELCKTSRGEVFMVPGNPKTADYIAELCREITENYDIDGIQLDYIRYPEKMYRFSDDNLYRKSAGASLEDWKRENITRIVRRVHDTVKPLKPWVRLSSSPIGKYNNLSRYHSGGWNCFTAVFQDPQAWLRDNIQDFLCPMMYFRDNHFNPYLFDWKENSSGHPVVPGLGIYFLDPSEGKWMLNDVRAEMHTARNTAIGGIAFYRSEFLLKNTKGLYTTACEEFFPYPALTARMTWSTDTIAPPAPERFSNDNKKLTWNAPVCPDAAHGGIRFNIYGSDTWPVDVTKAENLLCARTRECCYDLAFARRGKRFFAVTVIDRFGNESAPAQESRALNDTEEHNNKYLEILKDGTIRFDSDAETTAVYACSLTGERLRIATHADRINVSILRPGCYKLVRQSKGNRHSTIGVFMK